VSSPPTTSPRLVLVTGSSRVWSFIWFSIPETISTITGVKMRQVCWKKSSGRREKVISGTRQKSSGDTEEFIMEKIIINEPIVIWLRHTIQNQQRKRPHDLQETHQQVPRKQAPQMRL